MTDPHQSPAETLAAVLDVLKPRAAAWEWDECGLAFRTIHDPDPQVGEAYCADSKDDLARIVAMLTPEQRKVFDGTLWLSVAREDWLPHFSAAITAPASAWLAALAAAVGVDKQ